MTPKLPEPGQSIRMTWNDLRDLLAELPPAKRAQYHVVGVWWYGGGHRYPGPGRWLPVNQTPPDPRSVQERLED